MKLFNVIFYYNSIACHVFEIVAKSKADAITQAGKRARAAYPDNKMVYYVANFKI